MKMSISEIAKLSGVTVRTLHYYDEIGLLKPTEVVAETGYRYYDEDSLECLQQILFYKELDFQLKDIVKIIKDTNYDKKEALIKQTELLRLKRNRMNKLIALLEANLKGDVGMSFKEFDTSEIDEAKKKYAEEVKRKWGNTDAYHQNQEKTSRYSNNDWNKVNSGMESLIKEFSEFVDDNPANKQVQKLVAKWQQFINDTYYDCTNEILQGLGQMYVMDDRFTKSMDKYKKGTANLISEAIEIYCKK